MPRRVISVTEITAPSEENLINCTKFEASGKYHHLFNTATGASAGHYIAVSVFAPTAMVADALSTTLYVTPPARGLEVLASYPGVTALATLPDGTVEHLPV